MIDPSMDHAAPDAAFRQTYSLNSPLEYDSFGEAEMLQLEDVVYDDRPGPEELLYCKELKALFKKAFRQLTHSQQRIAYLYFRKNKNQIEIAKDLGISRSAVSQALSKSIDKMRQAVLADLNFESA